MMRSAIFKRSAIAKAMPGWDDFDCDDLVPLVFTREEDAPDVAFRFAAMGRFYVRLRLRITQAAIKIAARV